MAKPVVAGLIPEIVATGDWIVRITALDPTTGAVVSGVKISEASIAVRNLGQSQGQDAPLPLLVPVNLTI